jgi:C4-dicarboxylate-specific signal transduction histidine kinase
MEANDDDVRNQLEESALLGELARPLVHEFNNFLNITLLQMAVLESAVPTPPGLDFEPIRKESQKIVKLIQKWCRYIERQSEHAGAFDLHEVIRDLLKRPKKTQPRQVRLELLAGPFWVAGSILDWRRMCLLLFYGNLNERAPDAEKTVTVRTEKKQQKAILSVVEDSPPWTEKELAELFEPTRSVGSGLALAACKSLAYRLEGHLYPENQSAGGIALHFVTNAAKT